MFDLFHLIGRGPYFKKQPDGSLRHKTELCGDKAIEFFNDILMRRRKNSQAN